MQSQLKAVVSSIAIVIVVPVPSISIFCAAVDQDRFVLRAVGTLCGNYRNSVPSPRDILLVC